MPSPGGDGGGVERHARRGEERPPAAGRIGAPERHGERACGRAGCGRSAIDQAGQELGILPRADQQRDAALQQRRARQHQRQVVGEGKLVSVVPNT